MSDVRQLYQQIVMEHYRRPRNHFRIEAANLSAEVSNPLCGDRITLYVRAHDRMIVDIGFEGGGCAISQASASMMTSAVKEKSLDEANLLCSRFESMLRGGEDYSSNLADLSALAAVRAYPTRVRCALLAWRALNEAIESAQTARADAP